MKKFLVLFSLFVLPLVFYIFLSKGIYKYANLPILTTQVADIPQAENSLKGHLNVVCFLGTDVEQAKTSLFNLNQIIYKRYYGKPLFQMVAVLPENQREAYASLKAELATFTDINRWKFVYLNNEELKLFFEQLQTPYTLGDDLFLSEAFIVDMELRLRGRKDDDDTTDGRLYGYTTTSVAILKNKMKDDIDIIYYQLKKSAEKAERNKRKI